MGIRLRILSEEKTQEYLALRHLTLKVQSAVFPVTDIVEASKVYQIKRQESGEGASTFPRGRVFNGKDWIAVVSYNGRVWDLEDRLIIEPA